MQKNLYALRKEMGLTQDDVANYLHISQQTYRNKELGYKLFNAEEMFKLSHLFHKPIEKIFLPPNVPKWTKNN
ncbi:helix-turn-helix transcriptional regulator [Lactobacillus sp.]|uniref:helix-turn-helix transcriptional regulator n=1 Tax=Lactobacillus sp. TaxID=1591 RepID=UPI0019BD8A37|nr:helix-turn-helix transcriptional regulator [Lactobacillus sp.]MBD5429681.1 helix-turn-helix transcriptional regulator [Lactobacillus sp.]